MLDYSYSMVQCVMTVSLTCINASNWKMHYNNFESFLSIQNRGNDENSCVRMIIIINYNKTYGKYGSGLRIWWRASWQATRVFLSKHRQISLQLSDTWALSAASNFPWYLALGHFPAANWREKHINTHFECIKSKLWLIFSMIYAAIQIQENRLPQSLTCCTGKGNAIQPTVFCTKHFPVFT